MNLDELEKLARTHEAGHDADMRDEPECARCHDLMDSTNEPSAFCSGCMYPVADLLAGGVLALLAVAKAAREWHRYYGENEPGDATAFAEAEDALFWSIDALDAGGSK